MQWRSFTKSLLIGRRRFFFVVIYPFSTHDPPLAFCQVHDKTLQDFLFHIKAKVMDAFQVPSPPPQLRVGIDGCFFTFDHKAFAGSRRSLKKNERLDEYIEEAAASILEN